MDTNTNVLPETRNTFINHVCMIKRLAFTGLSACLQGKKLAGGRAGFPSPRCIRAAQRLFTNYSASGCVRQLVSNQIDQRRLDQRQV